MSEFRFKQFTVRQDHCPMKVGTDGVLLGAWTSVCGSERRILDIGTGTGLLALMLAQRASGAQITGVDLGDVTQARDNAAASPWGDRVTMVQCPVQEFICSGGFDLIVSNPPYFTESLTCPDASRTTARHTVTLPFEELREAVLRLLTPDGRFAVVLPWTETPRLLAVCAESLVLVRRTDVYTTPLRPAKRVLLEFMRAAAERSTADVATSTLVIGTGRHEEYTPEYRALTRDFYLKF